MTPKTPSRGYVESWDVESLSDSTKVYTVSRRKDGETYACSCPAWKFHPAPKPDCKHIKQIRIQLIQESVSSLRFIPDTVSTRVLPAMAKPTETTQPLVTVAFDGVVIGVLTRAQADQFRASMKKPAQPDVVVSGEFRIRRKFRFEE